MANTDPRFMAHPSMQAHPAPVVEQDLDEATDYCPTCNADAPCGCPCDLCVRNARAWRVTESEFRLLDGNR